MTNPYPMKSKFLLPLIFLVFTAQSQEFKSNINILHELNKLKNPTKVLYVAAHPDDENTRMISWLTNGKGCKTAYLSLTRGDGGQNLIGEELSAKLGVLRTQELMQARNIDGGTQFFSRAVDFGYSKNAEETFEKWGKEEVLHDVVWVIRKFKPDVIVTRFPTDSRGGHGHHTASAMLAVEAFEKAADETIFPEQLQYVETWQPKRIYWNTSIWWGDPLDSLSKNDDKYIKVEVGEYNPVLGLSCNELASMSRTQHKSQGFGVSVDRGSVYEYLYYLGGEKATNSLFDGIEMSWKRYDFEKGDKMLKKIIANYNPAQPQNSIEAIFELREEATAINEKEQRDYFTKKLNQIILACLGWHAELLNKSGYVTNQSKASLDLEVLVRTPQQVVLRQIKLGNKVKEINDSLTTNQPYSTTLTYDLSQLNKSFSQPYWLKNPYENLFAVDDTSLIGKPENDAEIKAILTLNVNGYEIDTEVAANHKYSDRVKGEIIDPVYITPDVAVKPEVDNMVFVKNKAQKLNLQIRFLDDKPVKLLFQSENGDWKIQPEEMEIDPAKGMVNNLEISITPLTDKNSLGELRVLVEKANNMAYNLTEIDYDHIDKRVVFEPAVIKLIKLDLQKNGIAIGYIPGAGDEVAKAIQQMGYQVEILSEDIIRNTDLSQYKSIVAGIRAYNTQDWLPGVKDILMEYVKNGGNYIVQYNTMSRDLLSLDIGPYPFQISRERVTEEDSDVDFLEADHALLNKPNKISEQDFENWVQERGLYFAGRWDEAYQAPLGWHDKDEPSRNGGLIIADYGKGAFVYTGISFFRELPAGVPGAFRLLANILSYKNPARYEQQ